MVATKLDLAYESGKRRSSKRAGSWHLRLDSWTPSAALIRTHDRRGYFVLRTKHSRSAFTPPGNRPACGSLVPGDRLAENLKDHEMGADL